MPPRLLAITAAVLGILATSTAFAQCSSGSCAARPMSMPRLGPSEMLISSQDLAAPTSERELLAQGFTKRTDANGRIVWSRPVSAAGVAVTQRPCLDGSCGSGNLRRAISDWVPAPRKDSPAKGPGAITSPKPDDTKPEPSPAPAPAAAIDYDKLASVLAEKLAADPRLRGPKGDAGEDGKDGKQGPPGPPGATPEVDYEQLASQMVAKLPPLKVQFVGNDNGKEFIHRELVVPVGGTLKLPPSHMQLVDQSGVVLEEGRAPLGMPIKLQLVPLKKAQGQ